ncbi:hypothetical protein R2601_21857 [Salipiger bermudensis HTCC2601]|uniref:Uncharacterized protein n=1 Tax=Salipiger bermudensis (strain DSM 26914 / JCM 13377 / KCTC 12554 / HTCC2601) TaxID=314265 RepID=Q0FN59_SALBH|nr:hypothetical protein R2601_21857 [Salipiger bermudensis HTCC2601]
MAHERLDRGPDDVQRRRRVDPEPERHDHQRREDPLLARGHVLDGAQALLDQVSQHHAAVEPERVGRREDHPRGGHGGDPGVDLEDAHQRQEFADEARGARQADIGHGEEHEDQRVGRHPVHQAAIGVDLAGVHPVVDDANAEEQRARDEAVADHLEDGTVDALLVGGKDAHGHVAHVSDRRIGDELLHVLLHQRDERGVDDGDGRHPEHQRCHDLGAHREHRQREAQEAVAAHLQQDRRQHDRARGGRLHVRIRQPGVHRPHRHLHREAGEEGEPKHGLQATDDVDTQHLEIGEGELVRQQRRDVGGAGIGIHRHHRHQHQDRAEEGVEEELEAGIDAVLAAPDADDQEHRDQACLEEQVEQHQVERHEHAEHQRLEQQEGDHVFLHPQLDVPAREDGQRHHEGGEHDEQHRDTVHAHLVVHPHDPSPLFHHLEAGVRGIELEQDEQRDHEGRRGGDHRQPLGVAVGGSIPAAQEQRQDQRRQRGQEGDDGQQVIH